MFELLKTHLDWALYGAQCSQRCSKIVRIKLHFLCDWDLLGAHTQLPMWKTVVLHASPKSLPETGNGFSSGGPKPWRMKLTRVLSKSPRLSEAIGKASVEDAWQIVVTGDWWNFSCLVAATENTFPYIITWNPFTHGWRYWESHSQLEENSCYHRLDDSVSWGREVFVGEVKVTQSFHSQAFTRVPLVSGSQTARGRALCLIRTGVRSARTHNSSLIKNLNNQGIGQERLEDVSFLQKESCIHIYIIYDYMIIWLWLYDYMIYEIWDMIVWYIAQLMMLNHLCSLVCPRLPCFFTSSCSGFGMLPFLRTQSQCLVGFKILIVSKTCQMEAHVGFNGFQMVSNVSFEPRVSSQIAQARANE